MGGELEERFQKMLKRVVEAQKDYGGWQAGGQLPSQKRPKRETAEISTLWNLLALRTIDGTEEKRPKIEEAADNWLASSELAKNKSAKSAEWFTMRLLLDVRREDDKAVASVYWGTTWAAIGLSQLLPIEEKANVSRQ